MAAGRWTSLGPHGGAGRPDPGACAHAAPAPAVHDWRLMAPPTPTTHPGKWATLVAATKAVRSTDPMRVQEIVSELSGRSRWLTPLAYIAGTLAVVFDGIRLLFKSWRLTLLQLVPAAWIYAMTWNIRSHLLAHRHPPLDHVVPIALAALVIPQLAYWCNATFAFTLTQDGVPQIGPAFAQARPHWRAISGLALVTGIVQATIWLVLPQWRLSLFWVALVGMFAVQIYLFVALPAWLIGVRKTGSRRERGLQTLTTGALSGIATMPGYLLNRIGLLLLSIGPLWWLGIAIVAIATATHVAGSSSARVVKMSVRLRGGGAPASP